MLVITAFSWQAPVFRDAEAVLYDLRAALLAESTDLDDRIVILTYDEKTVFDSKKHSPLDWSLLAATLAKLDGIGPKAVALDFIYDQTTEADEQLLQQIDEFDAPVYIAYVSAIENARSAWTDEEIAQQATANERNFHQRAQSGGAESTDVRLRLTLGRVVRSWPEISSGDIAPMSYALSGRSEPYDLAGYPINYRKSFFAATDSVFLKITLDEFLNGLSDSELQRFMADRYVLIGLDVPGSDEFWTPLSIINQGKMMPGVEVHASMLAQLLDDNWPPALSMWMIVGIGIAIIIMASITALSEMSNRILVPVLLIQLLIVASIPFLLHAGGWDTINTPAFGWLTCWILGFMIANSLSKAIGLDKRRFAQGALGKYLPDEVANQILADPDKLKLKGEKREIFALFSDLQGFTKLSHAIPPETVATLLNEYLQKMSDVVLDHGGTIDKFVGDAVVAFWGAPISHPDDAERAVKCAIAMWQCGEEFRKQAPEDVPPIGMTRVGLHFGEAIVGNFGGDDRIQYTALGDAMNTAARLESANKQTGTGVLISEDVITKLPNVDGFRRLGRVILSGRSSPTAICQPVDHAGRDEAARLNKLYDAFDKGDPEAQEGIRSLAEANPDDTALAKFCDRISKMEPGGSYVLEGK